MKLRIKDDSVRFRVPPSGVRNLIATGRLSSQVRFSLSPIHTLTYALVLDEKVNEPILEYVEHQIIARLPINDTTRWAQSDAIAIRHSTMISPGVNLTLLIEKDFACLDLSDEENKDTFPNPNAGQAC